MLRCCSQCGSNGHNSRTCRFSAAASAVNGGGSVVGGVGGEVMLFGVRLNEDPIRKSVSMSNLSQYEHTNNLQKKNLNSTNDVLEPSKAADEVTAGGGYASADDALPLPPGSARERKRGVPWTEEEHKLFLLGLQKVGKGDWRGISRNFVKTRTPTQVASHAQKYYLRKTNLNRRRRRSSLFDITTDSVPGMPLEEPKSQQDDTAQAIVPVSSAPPSETPRVNGLAVAPFPVTVGSYFWPVQVQNPTANMPVCQGNNYTTTSTVFVQPVPVTVLTVPNASATAALDLNQKMVTEPSPLSWRLSLLPDSIQSSTRHSVYKEASFNNGDSFITVA